MGFAARKRNSADIAATSPRVSLVAVAHVRRDVDVGDDVADYAASLSSDIYPDVANSSTPFGVDPLIGDTAWDAATATEESDAVVCHDLESYSLAVTLVLAAVIGLVALTTIAGNTLVVGAFFTDRKLRSFGNYFILNLAISDLVVGLLICVYAPYLLRGCWQLTRVGCLAFTLLDYVVPLASAWNMALISLDRYWAVARPIEYRLMHSTRRAVALMSVPWLAGTLWYGPTVLFWSEMTGRRAVPDGKCYVEFYDQAAFLIASSAVEFVLPFVTVASINILIYLNIRRRSRGLLETGDGDDNPQRTAKAKKLLARDKKSARSLAILIVVFLVTWAPFEICAFVNPICSFCIPDSTSEVVFWLLWLNSTINPILYPFLQERFRVAFLRIICFCCDRKLGAAAAEARRSGGGGGGGGGGGVGSAFASRRNWTVSSASAMY